MLTYAIHYGSRLGVPFGSGAVLFSLAMDVLALGAVIDLVF